MIVEIKGQDWRGTAEIKARAALRWCAAINASARYGRWDYFPSYKVSELVGHLNALGLSTCPDDLGGGLEAGGHAIQLGVGRV